MKIASDTFSILALIIYNAYFTLATPTNFTFDGPITHYDCPFKGEASIATDLSSITITYLSPQSSKFVVFQRKQICVVRIAFHFLPGEYVSIKEIEYKGYVKDKDGKVNIETKIAWDPDELGTSLYGARYPVHYAPVMLSGSESTKIASNSTMAVGQECNYPPEIGMAGVNVHITFNPSVAGTELTGMLTQRLALTWHGTCSVQFPECELLDNGGQRFVTCLDAGLGNLAIPTLI